jgi:Cft2 family RNA processing exonuclease
MGVHIYKVITHRHISHVPQTRGWEKKIAEGPPCVVLASPGFMQVGPSRELFELWAPDARNGLIITGYSVEGTPARVSAKRLWGGYLLFHVHNMHAMQQMDILISSPSDLQIQFLPISLYFFDTVKGVVNVELTCGYSDRIS